jgi:Bifunctional DNA primase/polymerase, N-terminal.
MNLKTAQAYIGLGFSLLPVFPADYSDADKRKRPVVSQWGPLQRQRPTDAELSQWFGHNGNDIALIGGAVSGGLVCVDVDTKADISGHLLEDFEELLLLEDQELYIKLVRQKTVSGGQHWLFRTQQKIGNNALACRLGVPERPGEIDEKTGRPKKIKLIETKAEGGYFLIAPSTGYAFLSGDLTTIPTLTSEEVETIFSLARSFNQIPEEHKVYVPAQREFKISGLTPWDDYNQRASIADVLQCLGGVGWTAFPQNEGYRLRRPDATKGTHASLNLISALPNFFHCFTESAAPFEGGKTYSPFAVMALCQYNGDFSKAAKELFKQGYGKRVSPATEETAWDLNTPNEIEVYKFSWEDNPQEENSLLTFCGEEILSPQGIALLTGPSGKGKTQACLAIAAACLNPECDSFQFKPNVNSILYVDTENPLKIFRKNIRRCIISRAGLMEGSQLSVDFVNIRMIETWEQRQKWLFDRLNCEDVPKLIIIDGAGDFILDVNDIPSSVDFVSRLCAATMKTRCGIFLTLHGNPTINSEKARGHIGSELLRKVDCSLLLKVEDEIRTITTEFTCGKNRSAADNLTTHFQWDPVLMMHASCDGPAPAKGKSATDKEKVLELGRTQLKWVRADIIKSIQGLLKNSKDESISFETAKRRFSEIVDSHDALKNDDGTYSFTAKEQIEVPQYYNN